MQHILINKMSIKAKIQIYDEDQPISMNFHNDCL